MPALKRLVFILFFLTVVVKSLPAQNGLVYKWGETNIIDYSINDFLGEDQDFLYAYVSRGSYAKPVVYLNKYSARDYSFSKTIEIKILNPKGNEFAETGKQNVQCAAIKMINNRFFLFSSYQDKERNTNTFYVSEFNSNGESVSRPEEMYVIENTDKKSAGWFTIFFSGNLQRIGLLVKPVGYQETSLPYTVKVFDSNIKPLYKKEVTGNPAYVHGIYTIDDLGNIALTTHTEELTADDKRNTKGANNKFIITTIDAESGDVFYHSLLFPVEGNTGYMNSCLTKFNRNGEVICSGNMDYENNKVKTTDGYFFVKYSVKKQEPLVMKTVLFSGQFLDYYVQDGKKTGSKLLQDFECQNVFPAADGGAFLVFEKFYWGKDARSSGPVIIVKTNADGTAAWEKMILKDQPGDYNNGNYFRNLSFMAGDKLYIIYNDNPDNENSKSIKEIIPVKKDFYSSQVIVKSFTNGGDVQKENFVQPNNLKLIFRPGNTFYNVPHTVYTMIFENGCKCHRFGKINWKE